MKMFLLGIFVAFLFIAVTLKAATLTVNNTTTSPGQYTSLQTAVNAANPGDTILVSGSPLDYASAGTITVNKPITLYGTGYHPIKDVVSTSIISSLDLQAGSSGTVIAGFIFAYLYSDQVTGGINSVTVRRNYFVNLNSPNLNLSGSNLVVEENIFYATVSFNGNNNVIKNNLINTSDVIGNTSGNTNTIFSNNVLTGTPVMAFYQTSISNNIFYNNGGVNASYFTQSYNSVINNNIDYNNSNANPFNIGNNGNVGNTNFLNTNPLFTTVVVDNGVYLDTLSNLALQASSPGHNAGSDGKDIGLYGGIGAQNPLTGTPPIPQITTMNIPANTVTPGATISIRLKAKSNN